MRVAVESASELGHPPAPSTLEEAGLNIDLIVQLILKTLHFAGELDGTELARRLGLNFPVIEPAVDVLKKEHHCAIVGGGSIGSVSYRYRITENRKSTRLNSSHIQKSRMPSSA